MVIAQIRLFLLPMHKQATSLAVVSLRSTSNACCRQTKIDMQSGFASFVPLGLLENISWLRTHPSLAVMQRMI
ncbi:hypothetical protein FA10DRAFT_267970 [Acaromyces ingoldii]|uniref:Uncharacterized protein n=1 Tax=Acaromyces ingoldii TaxID=215250 RepID=A0A316YIN0_9BASI|nr:hypothetical protein FA10DRAFT_267970 [Acaromyces ingoldii]PWN89400.1 hypothetical protein FA10DRAFT_267970 [Acaromyces ingoldii]